MTDALRRAEDLFAKTISFAYFFPRFPQACLAVSKIGINVVKAGDLKTDFG